MTSRDPDDDRLLALALRHLDGSLDAEGARALESLLRAEPRAADRFAALLVQVTQLDEIGREGIARVGAVRRRWMAGAVAGALACAVAAFLVARRPAPGIVPTPRVPRPIASVPVDPELPATIETARGEVRRVLGGIETVGQGSQVTARLADGSTVELGPDTLVSAARPGRITLERGRLRLEARAPVTLGARFAELRLPAGTVVVALGGAGVQVEVKSGAATLRRLDDTQTVGLVAGQSAALREEREEGSLATLRRIPVSILERLRIPRPNEEGLVDGNSKGFVCSGHQRYALGGIAVGAVLGKSEMVDPGLAAADAVFRFQAADGSFLDSAFCAAYFLGDLTHALIVLQESELAPSYAGRIEALRPRVARAAASLARPERVTELREGARSWESKSFVAATAYSLAGAFLSDGALRAIGATFLLEGLARQRPDGVMPMMGGADPSYQALMLWKLAQVQAHLPDPGHDARLWRAGQWLMTRVGADGAVDIGDATVTRRTCGSRAPCIKISWRDVTWALLFHGARHDPAALDLALRVSRSQGRGESR